MKLRYFSRVCLLVFVLYSLLLVGCQASSVKEPLPPAPRVDLYVTTSYGTEDGNRDSYRAAYTAYEQKTGNRVRDASSSSDENWKAKVMADFEVGAEPEILFFFTGSDSEGLVRHQRVVSLEEIRESYPDYATHMDSKLLTPSLVDGQHYAVPVNGYWEALYVNQAILQQAGVTLPEDGYDWDRFLEDCEKIAQAGYLPIGASLYKMPHYWLEYTVFNNGSPAKHLDLPTNTMSPQAQVWVDGLYDLKELYEKGFFPQGLLQEDEARQLFIEGEAAFVLEGSWWLGWLSKHGDIVEDLTVTYVPSKDYRRPSDMIGGISMGYYITRKAWDNPEKQQAAVEFVQHMTSDEVIKTFGITALTGVNEPPTNLQEKSQLEQTAYLLSHDATSFTPAAQDYVPFAVREQLFGSIMKVVTGDMTPEQAVALALGQA